MRAIEGFDGRAAPTNNVVGVLERAGRATTKCIASCVTCDGDLDAELVEGHGDREG